MAASDFIEDVAAIESVISMTLRHWDAAVNVQRCSIFGDKEGAQMRSVFFPHSLGAALWCVLSFVFMLLGDGDGRFTMEKTCRVHNLVGSSLAVGRTEIPTLSQQRELQRAKDERRRERSLSESERRAFDDCYRRGIGLISRGRISQGQFNKAVQSFLTCLKLDPDDYRARFVLGQGYLRMGQFAEAAETFRLAAEKAPDLAEARYFLGVALMRMSRYNEAIQPLKEAIDRAPEYLKATWNLMIACMQAGKDPKTLEERYRLILAPGFPPSHEPVRFTDVGPQAGVARVNMGRGSAWRDLDHDGWLDLFTVAEGSTHTLFHNNGDGTFTDITRQAGVADPRGGWSALWVDYDNDGAPDLFVTRDAWTGPGTNTLYHNNGDETFTDVTREAGLGGGADGFCAAWGDYDNDGWLDLYVANGVSQDGWPNALYHNNGDGTFSDVTFEAGVHDELRRSIGVVWGDYDNDGWLDLYVVNIGARNTLFHNDGDGTFTDVTAAAGVANPFRGFVAFFFDYDNDGWLDLFVSSWTGQATGRMEEVIQSMIAGEPASPVKRPALYHNNRDGTFTDVTQQAGLARTFGTMAATYGDVDNDGYQDIYLANGGPPMDRFEPDRLFLNNGDGTFSDVTDFAGVGNIGKGHGTTMADYDNDGDLDIYAPEGGMGGNPGDNQPNRLYRNEGNDNNWLVVKTVGTKSNRDGIGAKVKVTTGSFSRYAEVSGGCGFGSTNSLQLEFGLGSYTKVVLVEVKWPSGIVDRIEDVAANQVLTVKEGASKY